MTLNVPEDKSIVQVLRANGVEAAASHDSGIRGTCRTWYLEGGSDNYDYILRDKEQREDILVSRSRPDSPMLVLEF